MKKNKFEILAMVLSLTLSAQGGTNMPQRVFTANDGTVYSNASVRLYDNGWASITTRKGMEKVAQTNLPQWVIDWVGPVQPTPPTWDVSTKPTPSARTEPNFATSETTTQTTPITRSESDRTTYVGPRGGVYHYSASGKKVYHKKK
jgi:hypothetical protein